MIVFLILISIFISISYSHKKREIIYQKEKYREAKIRKLDEEKKTDIENINILTVAYELTYDKNSVLKVVLKSIDQLDHDFGFNALLKSVDGKKEYNLKCDNISDTEIECYSEKNVKFDVMDRHYFYYKSNGKLTLDENEVMEDWRKVTLIFKPEMYEGEIMWLDNRKILGLNNRKIIGGGYLYLVPIEKKLLHFPKDGFNKYIELNNFISHAGLYGEKPESSLTAYKEAIRRGFHMVDADLQFTKDKIPVIIHATELENVSNGKGKVSEFTLDELKKLDFGSKFDEKYAGEQILIFEDLLNLCKNNEIIIDLNLEHLDYNKYFEKTDEYMKILINIIEKYDMLDSLIFNEGPNPNTILKLKALKKDISISLSNINKISQIKEIKEKYSGTKRIIINFSGVTNTTKIDETLLNAAKTSGYKIKVGIIDDEQLANKLQLLGVNFIITNKLHPFQIKNDYEYPFLLKCTQFDVLADCRLGPEVKLIDTQIYRIYYSTNIYKLNEDIIDETIGEFQYLDTMKLDDMYYSIKKFDFDKAYLRLNSSVEVEKGKSMKGKIGPSYKNVADCYLYDYVCEGNNKFEVDCKILKNDSNIVKYDGNYSIHLVENYSKYFPENLTTEQIVKSFTDKNRSLRKYLPSIIFITIATIILIISIKNSIIKMKNKLKKVDIKENTYVPETTNLKNK